MQKQTKENMLYDVVSDNVALMSKIYQSFEALEQTLGALQLEEPLFMTYAAKKSFADAMMKHNKGNSYKN
ncbi:MAG: hypothetical protein IKK52_02745 [Alphaproteobacteria bacterium]|nr:hypothetical protein [Alphaproteobacteria bacterium]